MGDQIVDYEGITIPTYIINLKERTERLSHILEQFKDKPEFEVHIIEAYKHEIGAVGLWESVVKVVKLAKENGDDVIIICKDDHEFTAHYSKAYLIQNIIEANEQGVAILSGGIRSFGHAVPLTANRMWVNPFESTQFIVLFKKIFDKILKYKFKDNDVADVVLAEMTSHKMTLFPFISLQRDFGYSDITSIHDEEPGHVQNMLKKTISRLETIQNVYLKYRSEV
ncbi:glycosyltransferase family 25 protein [Pedobacter nyackensis]|uniref:Glycosyl transferase, family 25 n=1 Tax=Pedobacter nyackensis TaxID=475255 RepID=A0A1W2ALN7_9SPHI|nr:glycosyl transferase [Pedobacter nyackensis]SMC61138.1 glycosyl transferase, family 25 [Pedobacter nyackensis]